MDGIYSERGKRYILVVHGNYDDRFITGMLLQQFGYNICTAGKAEEAVEFMHVAQPSAVVAEGGSPGALLMSRIKKDRRFADIPLIIISALRDGSMEDRVRRGEISAFLLKPLNPEDLYRAIQASVEKTPRRNLRITVCLKASIGGDPGAHNEYATILSEYGMFLRTLDPLPANTIAPVALEIKDRTVKLEAIVLYSYSFADGPFKEPGMGMKFVKINAGDQALIKEFILEQVEEGIPRKSA